MAAASTQIVGTAPKSWRQQGSNRRRLDPDGSSRSKHAVRTTACSKQTTSGDWTRTAAAASNCGGNSSGSSSNSRLENLVDTAPRRRRPQRQLPIMETAPHVAGGIKQASNGWRLDLDGCGSPKQALGGDWRQTSAAASNQRRLETRTAAAAAAVAGTYLRRLQLQTKSW